MTDRERLPEALTTEANHLDHAAEFAACVAAEAPAEYAELFRSPSIQRLLAEDNAFNPGKLYAWAEYRVFRREFIKRFPEASPRAAINAFCKLFLKNDISMSNLVRAMEKPPGEELARLERSGANEKEPAG